MEQNFIIDSSELSPEAREKKRQIENNPACRTNPMEYLPDMEQISSDVREQVMKQVESYEYKAYTSKDVEAALSHEVCTVEDFKALCEAAHERGIKVILDGVYSHTGSDSLYFNKQGSFSGQGAYQSHESPYSSWYTFYQWPNSSANYTNVEIPLASAYFVGKLLYPEAFSDIEPNEKAEEIFAFFLGHGEYLQLLQENGLGFSEVRFDS